MAELEQTISVVMATFNGAAYVREQLESIARQTRRPDEILIGDDQSSDETLSIVSDFARGSGLNISVTRNTERLGAAGNFERLLLRSSADIIVFADQDDIWFPKKLERIGEVFSDDPQALYVFSDGQLIDELGQIKSSSLWDRVLFSNDERRLFRSGRGAEVLLRHNVVTGAAMAVRRRAVGAALPIPQGWIHDAWLAQVLQIIGGGRMIEQPLIYYRLHPKQQIGVVRMSPSYVRGLISRYSNGGVFDLEAQNLFQLAVRLEQVNGCPVAVERLREKHRFYLERSKMRKEPRCAPGLIFASWRRGDYERFSPRFKFVLPAMILDALCAAVSSASPKHSR